mmetsp:Transcript_18331/g.55184  ORF Transcript_18331/g.55184 Transcript_18331/m.55184 type:complete len:267 (-) Transcript_18331:1050-1850(-)
MLLADILLMLLLLLLRLLMLSWGLLVLVVRWLRAGVPVARRRHASWVVRCRRRAGDNGSSIVDARPRYCSVPRIGPLGHGRPSLLLLLRLSLGLHEPGTILAAHVQLRMLGEVRFNGPMRSLVVPLPDTTNVSKFLRNGGCDLRQGLCSSFATWHGAEAEPTQTVNIQSAHRTACGWRWRRLSHILRWLLWLQLLRLWRLRGHLLRHGDALLLRELSQQLLLGVLRWQGAVVQQWCSCSTVLRAVEECRGWLWRPMDGRLWQRLRH